MKSIQHKRNQVPQLQIFFLVGGFGRSIIIGLLRTLTDLMTSCLLHLVVLFLTSLGLGDSHLVILPLCSLVLFFFVINFILCLVFLFVSVTSACFVSFCIKQLFEYTSFLLIQRATPFQCTGTFTLGDISKNISKSLIPSSLLYKIKYARIYNPYGNVLLSKTVQRGNLPTTWSTWTIRHQFISISKPFVL